MKYTAKDIAKILNVSPATISLAINNKPGISMEKRKQILKKIQELGQDDMIAHQGEPEPVNIGFLVFQRLDIIAEQPYYTYILENMYEEAANYNFKVHFLKENYRSDIDGLRENLEQNNCKGLVVFATEMSDSDVDFLSELNLPIIYLDNSLSTKSVDSISIDNWQGVRTAIGYLAGLGHERIGYLKSSTQINSFNERYQAYQQSLMELGLPYEETYTVKVDYGELKAYHAMNSYLAAGNKLPTAFIADNDLLAASAIEALATHGYRIPEEISVMGFDNRPLCTRIAPELTTIKVFKRSFLQLAFRCLMERIENKRDYTLKIKVGTQLIERGSVGKCNNN